MFITTITSLYLAFATATHEAGGSKKQPVDHEGAYFCCDSADENSGEGCVEITKSVEDVDECEVVLHCESAWWWTEDGGVACG